MSRALVTVLVSMAVLAMCQHSASSQITRPTRPPAPKISAAEQTDLDLVLSEAGSSTLEYLRAIEKHIAKYPDSARRDELERAAARAAIEINDEKRIVIHGERVLDRDPDDLQILDRVTRALLADESKETAERALAHARHYEELVRRMQSENTRSPAKAAEWQDQTDHGIGQALDWQARAIGNLGRFEDALATAKRAFETWPNSGAAREIARWYERLGKPAEAALAMADAFTIPDARSSDADRLRDRGRMGDLYRQAKGSEAGLGELVLDAYDRNVALVRARELRLRANDGNAYLTDPMQFTLSALEGPALSMAALKGKVVVLDFWATWCVPCRGQHPLYEQVKRQFHDNSGVVFLSIDTDEDRTAVKPFLDQVHWTGPVYFEDGLSRAVKITSIPTTLVLERGGQIYSRLNGYRPDKFVEMLSTRIRDALGN